MSMLEDRYRRVLRLLPASYRADREEEMVAAFLEGAGDVRDDDDARPRWSEIGSVAALAVRVRLGSAGTSPRSFATGQAVRLTALLGLFAQAVLSCMYLAYFLRLYGLLGTPPDLGVDYDLVIGPAGSAMRLEHIVGGLVAATWIAAYVALVRGHRRATKVLALLALVPLFLRWGIEVVSGVRAQLLGADGAWESLQTALPYSLPAIVPVLALLAGFHRDAPPVRRAAWLAVLPVGAGVLLAVTLGAPALRDVLRPLWPWADDGGILCLLIIGAGLAYGTVHAFVPARRTPVWPLALALLAVPALATRIAAWDVYFSQLHSSDPMGRGQAVAIAGQAGAVLLTGVVLLVLGVAELRRLPASPDRSGGDRSPVAGECR